MQQGNHAKQPVRSHKPHFQHSHISAANLCSKFSKLFRRAIDLSVSRRLARPIREACMPAKVHSKAKHPLVGIIMGSTSDWETMSHAAHTLDTLHIPYETRVVSAHRTPDLLFAYASRAEQRGI